MTDNEKEILLPLLKQRIPYDEDIFEEESVYEMALTQLLEDGRNILLSKLYPFEDYSSYTIPAHKYNWVLRCSVELYKLGDKIGVTSYAENGLSWSRFSDGLSNSLMTELISHVGIPKSATIEEINEEDVNGDDNV